MLALAAAVVQAEGAARLRMQDLDRQVVLMVVAEEPLMALAYMAPGTEPAEQFV